MVVSSKAGGPSPSGSVGVLVLSSPAHLLWDGDESQHVGMWLCAPLQDVAASELIVSLHTRCVTLPSWIHRNLLWAFPPVQTKP